MYDVILLFVFQFAGFYYPLVPSNSSSKRINNKRTTISSFMPLIDQWDIYLDTESLEDTITRWLYIIKYRR